jgi:hypothetical protein
MSAKEIQKYYETINELIDKNDKNEIIQNGDALTEEELEDIKTKRLYSNEIFENDLIICRKNGGDIYYSRTLLLPDGYFHLKNYEYGINYKYKPSWGYKENWNELVNPLRSYPGFIILERDTNVYHVDDNKIKGLLRKGTVLRILYLDPSSTSIYLNTNDLIKYHIKIEDINILRKLVGKADYKIVDNKVYRYIDGLQIEINTNINYMDDGTRYIRRDYSDEFYFWEYWCDYFFDDSGNFFKYDYGPGYGH